MPMLKTEGRHIVRPIEWTIEESGKNKLPTFVCRFGAIYHFNDQTGDWDNVSEDDASITGYFYLIKNDGNENDRTIENLKKVLGWDGRSFSSLVGGDYGELEVQITTAYETFEGKESLKLKWLNPRDFVPTGGALKPADLDLVKSLDARYGAKLRASAGPSKASAPAPTTNAAEAAKRTAWEAFQKAWESYTPQPGEDRNSKWKAMATEKFGTKVQSGAVSAAEWNQFADGIKANGFEAPTPDDAPPGYDGPPPGIHKENKAARQAAKAPAMAMAGGGDEHGNPEDDPNHPDHIPFAWAGRSTRPL